MASSISITNYSGLDVLTTTVNPISMYVQQDDTPYTYLLFTLPGTETTGTATISITNNTGYIYGAIIGPPGNAGLSSGNNGGGGGGSGAFCNFPFYQSNSNIQYTVSLNSSNSSENSITSTTNEFNIYVEAGANGYNATDNSGGDGGKGASIDVSNMTLGSVSMSDCQFSGGGGGGGGSGSSNGDGGNGGSATTDGTTVETYTVQGEDGGTGNNSNSSGTSGGGFGGSTSYIFSDGTSILVSAGEGAYSTSNNTSTATSGSLSWVMIYYRTNQVTFSNSSSSTSTSTITPLIDITVTEYNNGSTSTPTVNTISTTNFNPFTYYNNTTTSYTYTLVDCLPTDTSNNENYYTCSFTVPNDANTYYWAGIGAGGLPGSNSYDSNNSGDDSGGGGGGGGAGAFLNLKLLNNCTYEFKMFSLNYNNKLTITTSSNETYTYTIPSGVNGDDGGLMEVDEEQFYIGQGGAGGAGGSFENTTETDIVIFPNLQTNGGGGGGAFQQSIPNNGQSYYVKSGKGGSGGDAFYINESEIETIQYYGVNGTDGEPGATSNNTDGYIDEGGVGGNTKYTFFDGSSVFVSAGHGTYGTYTSNSGSSGTRINATSGTVTWMMIYGPT